MKPSSPRNVSSPLADPMDISFFQSNISPNTISNTNNVQPQEFRSEEVNTDFESHTYSPKIDRAGHKNSHDASSGNDSHTSSIYDFLVRDMMPNDEPTMGRSSSSAQTNFQKFSSGFSDRPLEQSKAKDLPLEGDYNDARTNDNNFFSYFQDAKTPPSNDSAQQIGTVGEDRASLMLKIINNLNQHTGPQSTCPSGQWGAPGAPISGPSNTIWNTFPVHNHGQALPNDGVSAARSLNFPSEPMLTKSFSNHTSQPSHDGTLVPTSVTKTLPSTLPFPPSSSTVLTGPTEHLIVSENQTNPQQISSALYTSIQDTKKNVIEASEIPLLPEFTIHQNNPAVTVGPRNAPGIGYYTHTVLSSYSFNLPSQGGLRGDVAEPEKSNLSFPPLLVMEISPSTLYLLHANSVPNIAIPAHTIGDFLGSLHPVTAYTLKLIASSNAANAQNFNELQIAVLHCTFIINPNLRAFPGIDERRLHQQCHQMGTASPYNAPSPYHVIQFRSLISQVTYIPLPEYLFDIQTNTFGNSTPQNESNTFNEYYSANNNSLNCSIRVNTSMPYVKHSSLSLFIGQTTYRTTPSVLHYIFNVICKIEIVEVEVMRKQPCAFFYVYLRNEHELRQCINKLHKKILFDLHGIWYAQNEQEEEKLRNFVRIDREKMFPVLPLPKQCMVVERRNSIGGPQHGRHAPHNLNRQANYMPHVAPMSDMRSVDTHMNPYHQPNIYPSGPHSHLPISGHMQNIPPNGYDSHYHQNMNYLPYPNDMPHYPPNQGGFQVPPYTMPPMAPVPSMHNPIQHLPYPAVPNVFPGKPVDAIPRQPILQSPSMMEPNVTFPPGSLVSPNEPNEIVQDTSTKRKTFTLCMNTISTAPKEESLSLANLP